MSRQSFSSGEYQNTNEVRKWLAKIQIDTMEAQVYSYNGFGYIEDETEHHNSDYSRDYRKKKIKEKKARELAEQKKKRDEEEVEDYI